MRAPRKKNDPMDKYHTKNATPTHENLTPISLRKIKLHVLKKLINMGSTQPLAHNYTLPPATPYQPPPISKQNSCKNCQNINNNVLKLPKKKNKNPSMLSQ